MVHFNVPTGAPAGMGKRGHLPPSPRRSGNVVKCFCALAVTAKRLADESFMHYFHNLSSASGGFTARATGAPPTPTPLGDFSPETPNLPTPPEKILRAPMCAKVNMMWVDAIANFHFQCHFEGHKSDVCSIVEMLSYFCD